MLIPSLSFFDLVDCHNDEARDGRYKFGYVPCYFFHVP